MSWFLCPLIADAAGLGELYPLAVVPKTRNTYDLGTTPSTQKPMPGEPGSSREMQIDEEDEDADPATPVRSSRQLGKRAAKKSK